MYVLGIDPGPIAGVTWLQLEVIGDKWSGRSARVIDAQALQVTSGALVDVLEAINAWMEIDAVALERFVVGRRSARSSTPAAGTQTRDMVGAVLGWAGEKRVPYFARSAAEVKPWATDKRLEATDLLGLTRGMRHARDAGRHALFCAVKDFGLADPLSQRGREA